MNQVKLSVSLTGVALAVAVASGSAVAVPCSGICVNNVIVAAPPNGYMGAGGNFLGNLSLSTQYDLGLGAYVIQQINFPDNTLLAVGDFATFTGPGLVSSGPPNAILNVPVGLGTMATDITKTIVNGSTVLLEHFISESVISRGILPNGNSALTIQLDGTYKYNGVTEGNIALTLAASNNFGTNSWSANEVGTPSVVPIPGGLLLFGSVLGGAGMIMRRQKVARKLAD